jgi:uncharacterized membrane protein
MHCRLARAKLRAKRTRPLAPASDHHSNHSTAHDIRMPWQFAAIFVLVLSALLTLIGFGVVITVWLFPDI